MGSTGAHALLFKDPVDFLPSDCSTSCPGSLHFWYSLQLEVPERLEDGLDFPALLSTWQSRSDSSMLTSVSLTNGLDIALVTLKSRLDCTLRFLSCLSRFPSEFVDF